MHNKSVVWLHKALQDLYKQMLYLEEVAGSDTAKSIAERIWIAGQGLRFLSSRGRPGKVPGTRELILTNAPYYISYRERGNEVQILRIIHFSQNYPVQ